MRKLVLPVLLVICTSAAIAGTTQETKSAEITISTDQLKLSAEQLISDSTAGTIKARGNVNVDIRNGRFKIHADEVEVSVDKELLNVVSRGNVQMDMLQDDGSTRTINTNGSHLQLKR